MTKEEIRAAASKGLSEDLNGEFYTIYDFDKLYDMIVAKSVEWISKKTYLDPGEYKRFMEDKETLEVPHFSHCPECKANFLYEDSDIVDGIWIICPDCGNKLCILE